MLLGAIEAGGTKFILAIGNELGEINERQTIATTDTKETMEKIFAFFDGKKIDALGIACFGPIDLNKNSDSYGHITTTPKKGWKNFDIVGTLKNRYNIPIGFDTDVNAAALAEATLGIAKECENVLYLTVGTGIGGGFVMNGRLNHGILHPEMGHISLIVRDDDNYGGNCPYHKNCLEGMAAGPAIEARWNCQAEDLDCDHRAWDLEAYYLGQAIANYILVLSPNKVILGGGVMQQKHLFPLVNKYVQLFLGNYMQSEHILTERINDYIVTPKLGNNVGIVGALLLAVIEITDNIK